MSDKPVLKTKGREKDFIETTKQGKPIYFETI